MNEEDATDFQQNQGLICALGSHSAIHEDHVEFDIALVLETRVSNSDRKFVIKDIAIARE